MAESDWLSFFSPTCHGLRERDFCVVASGMRAKVLWLPNPTHSEEEGLAAGRPKKEKRSVFIGSCLPVCLRNIPFIYTSTDKEKHVMLLEQLSFQWEIPKALSYFISASIPLKNAHFSSTRVFIPFDLLPSLNWFFSSWQSPIKLTYHNGTKGEKKREKRLCSWSRSYFRNLSFVSSTTLLMIPSPGCLEVRVVLILSAF